MIQKHVTKSDKAVSPVVGVMLMLVVTIIIAGVVTVFATGLVSTTAKAPQLLLTGTYSQTDGMTITHAGGEAIAFSTTNFITTPSELMGSDAEKYAYQISKDIIFTSNGVNLTNITAPGGFSCGETLYIPKVYCIDKYSGSLTEGMESTTEPWMTLNKTIGLYIGSGGKLQNNGKMLNANAMTKWDSTSTPGSKAEAFAPYEFMNTANIGKYFYLDLVDKTGSIITRAKITITA